MLNKIEIFLRNNPILFKFARTIHSLFRPVYNGIKNVINKILRQCRIKKVLQISCPYKVYQSSDKHTFFGYYDKSPFSKNGKFLLAMTVDIDNQPLKDPCVANIGYFDLNTPDIFVNIGLTTTWCWQQGARLMWFPSNESQLILYNKPINGSFGSVIQDIETKQTVRKMNFPVYDIEQTGRFAATLNFGRLARLRPGYGYINFPDITKDVKIPENDGVWICDIQQNKKELILSMDRLARYNKNETIPDGNHYVNHLCFNPEGSRLLFFHIIVTKTIRRTMAFTCDLDGENLVLLNDGRNVSHYTWKNNDELLFFSEGEKGYAYYLHKDHTAQYSDISSKILINDGHPSFVNPYTILTDTCPLGFFHEQKLLFLTLSGKISKIAMFYSPFSYQGEIRCDLHPRYDANLNKVCVDTPISKGRKMIVIDI